MIFLNVPEEWQKVELLDYMANHREVTQEELLTEAQRIGRHDR